MKTEVNINFLQAASEAVVGPVATQQIGNVYGALERVHQQGLEEGYDAGYDDGYADAVDDYEGPDAVYPMDVKGAEEVTAEEFYRALSEAYAGELTEA